MNDRTPKYAAAVDHARSMPGALSPDPFPFYLRHAEAVCHLCDGPLRDHRVSSYAPQHGAFMGTCPFCPRPANRSWYDCAEGTVEMIATREARDRGEL